MPQKIYNIDDVGNVTFYKLRKSKSIRIKINGNSVKVTLPVWAPYRSAIEFVNTRKDWIRQNLKIQKKFQDGSIIGQNYQLRLVLTGSSKFYLKESGNILAIHVPEKHSYSDELVQKRIEKYVTNILKRDAEDKLIPLARQLASENSFEVKSLEVKKLKSRWGSCNSQKDIVLNLYLIQLPEEHIRYVIFHELAHTVHLNHSSEFWNLVQQFVPNYKEIKKDIKLHSPDILIS